MKRFLCSLLALCSILLCTACTPHNNAVEEDQAPRIVRLLQERYDTEFEVTKVNNQADDRYIVAQARVKEDPALLFSVTVNTQDDNMSESYIERKLCTEVAAQLGESLSDSQDDYCVFCTMVGPQPITADTSLSVQDYMDLDPYNSMHVLVFIGEKVDYIKAVRGLQTLARDLGYIEATAELYTVSATQLQDIKEYFSERDTLDDDFNYIIASLDASEFSLALPAKDLLEQMRFRFWVDRGQ